MAKDKVKFFSRRQKMKKNKLKIILIIIVFAVALFKLGTYIQDKNKNSNNTVFVSGNIETTEVRASFQVAGKIKELFADEGKIVYKGALLARLDTDEFVKLKMQAEAALKEANFNYDQLKEDYERTENLFVAGVIPAQKRDTAKTNADMAKAKLHTLKANLDLVGIRLNYADLISPMDGFVLVKSAEVGEVIQIGAPIFTLANLQNIWLTAYINETDLGRVKLNQEARIKIDTYPDKMYSGRISFISQETEFTPKQIQTKEERAKLVYRIKISIDNANMELKPGMPADAYIDVK